MREGEEKLVENFAELRTGMVIVYRPCLHCGGRHRTQLGNFRDGVRGLSADGDWEKACGFLVFVQPPCMKLKFLITPEAVRQRLIYRIEDGLENRDERTKRPELVDAGDRPQTLREVRDTFRRR